MQSKQIETSDRAVRQRAVEEVTINWRLSFEPGANPEWAVCRLDDECNEMADSEVRFESECDAIRYVVAEALRS